MVLLNNTSVVFFRKKFFDFCLSKMWVTLSQNVPDSSPRNKYNSVQTITNQIYYATRLDESPNARERSFLFL